MTLEDDITRLEDDLEGTRAPMQAAHNEFVRAAAAWAADWWPKQAKAVAVAHPERTKEAGKLALTRLKGDVAGLVEQAGALATEDLTDEDSGWPHLAADLEAPEPETGSSFWRSPFRVGTSLPQTPPTVLESSTRDLLTRLAVVLTSHGFPTSSDRHVVYHSGPGNDYRHHKWSAEMFTTLDAYAGLHDQLNRTRFALKDARRALEERDAEALWDDAEEMGDAA